MTKDWAFTSETGFGRMTASAASRIRWAKYGGAPLPEDKYKFWSRHDVGSRQRLKHVQKEDVIPFFSYNGNAGSCAGQGGESLAHELYKFAIARLTKTQLRFKNGNYDIRITHAETEKTIHMSTGDYYRPDVYFRFECDGRLSSKWSGELYVEVWHMHRVPPAKIENLVAHRVPVVQVRVPDVYVYRYDGETTTDELEEQYITDMVGKLEKYMVGYVLSDPSSADYLKEDIRLLNGKIAKHEKLAIEQIKEVQRLLGTIETLEGDTRRLSAERDALSRKLREQREGYSSEMAQLNRKAIVDDEEIRSLKDEIIGLKEERTDLLGALKERTKALFVASSVALLGVLVCAYAILGK